jgi:putative flavoprotein involved in K+ transport
MTQKSVESGRNGSDGSRYQPHQHYSHEARGGDLPRGALVEEGSAFLHLTDAAGRENAARENGRFDVIVIGAGQAGLSVGYYLAKRGARFVILDANPRVGDSWRNRWDSLRLFTAARFDGLAGMPFPAPPRYFPTKDEMADYLESYAKRFALPVKSSMRVERLWREGDRYVVEASGRRFEAAQVVVAMASYQKPRIPDFARQFDPGIVQLHSSEYRNPGQLREGGLLIVGAGNSGAEIALDVARGRSVWMSGREVGHVPFRIDRLFAQLVLVPALFRLVFHRLLTTNTPLGRKARPKIISQGGPLIRVKPKDLAAAGVERVPRVVEARDGRPVLSDGRVLDVANVIWCSGFHPGFSWIELPVLDAHGEPKQVRGVIESAPGLYFVGLHFLYAFSSTMIHGIARDAKYVADAVERRAREAGKASGIILAGTVGAPSPQPSPVTGRG